jgi:iron complex outermembrane receptor protein
LFKNDASSLLNLMLNILKHSFLFIISIFFFTDLLSQDIKNDTIKVLNEVKVKAYLSDQTLINTPSSAIVISQNQITKNNTSQSLMPILNSIAGVKMEERSPGSYRLSIRGSLLRSPFGVRNLKVYYDGLPLTDAGGNTYLNLIDQSAIKNIEILKGPDGSLFGANSGGVVLLNTDSQAQGIAISATNDSYGLLKLTGEAHQQYENLSYNFFLGNQESNGYRENSAMKRIFFNASQNLEYRKKGSIKFSGFISNLDYETPGGLNRAQYDNNPQQARLATATLPSATTQQAAIYNKSLFGGLTHQYQFNKNWKHVFSVSGLTTNFKNPFITNYELRNENSLAFRTYVVYQKEVYKDFNYQWNFGGEFQNTNSDIRNYRNNRGFTGNIIAADRIQNQSYFAFSRLTASFKQKLNAEISSSINFANYSFKPLPESINPVLGFQSVSPQWMPKLALSYVFNSNFVARSIVSRGFSAPTTAEIRASDAVINANLNPETGWNYEFGLRWRTPFERIYIDASAFYYRLNNAIVRRVNANDQDNFVNAGGTDQKGVEVQLNADIIRGDNFIKLLNFSSGLTLNNFKFRDYLIGNLDFSGNRLTGVPKFTAANNINIILKNRLELFAQYQYVGKSSLNDAETVFANPYHLVMAKFSYPFKVKKYNIVANLGVDNILNQKYSLGNDINAFGGRYFNAATPINCFFGLSAKLF